MFYFSIDQPFTEQQSLWRSSHEVAVSLDRRGSKLHLSQCWLLTQDRFT